MTYEDENLNGRYQGISVAPKIRIENVSKTFALASSKSRSGYAMQLSALENVSLDIRAGEFVVLVGPSGCGKSSLLDLLAGLTLPTSGRILVDGEPIKGPGLERAVVFQQYALFPWRTVQRNVEFGLEARGNLSREERRERASYFLNLVGLAGFAERYPHELSGGMRQRVAIARSLVYEPQILLMDEPFAALDAQTREALQDELLQIWSRTKVTAVFITHSVDEAVFLGQRVAVMTARPGQIKGIVDTDHSGDEGGDVRASAAFVKSHREVWGLLHEELEDATSKSSGHNLAVVANG
jgi:NitT/TauT family transport system ATP-binding protein